MTFLTTVTVKCRETLSDIYNFTIGRFINKLFSKPSSVLFLGIDNAGKTTLVNKLKNNTNHVFLPTKHATKDVIQIGNLKASIFDIGGHRAARMVWKDYFYDVDGIVFLVDSADTARFQEVADAWASVRQLESKAPILVLVNKIDLLGEDTNSAPNNPQLRGMLDGAGIIPSRSGQLIELFYLSIVRESVYDEHSVLSKAFAWLAKSIETRNINKEHL